MMKLGFRVTYSRGYYFKNNRGSSYFVKFVRQKYSQKRRQILNSISNQEEFPYEDFQFNQLNETSRKRNKNYDQQRNRSNTNQANFRRGKNYNKNSQFSSDKNYQNNYNQQKQQQSYSYQSQGEAGFNSQQNLSASYTDDQIDQKQQNMQKQSNNVLQFIEGRNLSQTKPQFQSNEFNRRKFDSLKYAKIKSRIQAFDCLLPLTDDEYVIDDSEFQRAKNKNKNTSNPSENENIDDSIFLEVLKAYEPTTFNTVKKYKKRNQIQSQKQFSKFNKKGSNFDKQDSSSFSYKSQEDSVRQEKLTDEDSKVFQIKEFKRDDDDDKFYKEEEEDDDYNREYEDISVKQSAKFEKGFKQTGNLKQQFQQTTTVNQLSKYSSFNQVHKKERGKEKPFIIPRSAFNEEILTLKLNPFFRMLRGTFQFHLEDQKLQIGPVPGIGLGLFTKYPIKKGEELIRIPKKMILDAQSALKDSYDGDQMLQAQCSDKTILALYLCSIMQMRGRKWSARQKWSGYVKALPQRTGSLAEWGARKHRSYIKHILRLPDFIEQGKQMCLEFLQYHKQVEKYKSLIDIKDDRDQKAFVPAIMDWSFGTVEARGIRFGDDGRIGLVPFLDFFNHDPNAAETIKWDTQKQEVFVVAAQNYNRGEEIKIKYYGTKNSRQLLLQHGFTPKQIWNPHDRFEVYFQLRKSDAFFEAKTKFLKELKGSDDSTVQVGLVLGKMNEEGLRFCCFAVCNPQDGNQVAEYGRKIIQKGDYNDVLLEGLERYQETIRKCIQRVHKQLQESNEDKEKLSDSEISLPICRYVDWQNRKAVNLSEKWVRGYAADVRIREFKILNSAAKAVNDKITKLNQIKPKKSDDPSLGRELKDSHAFLKYKTKNMMGITGVADFM